MAAPFVTADCLSAILNLVCPECGGRMGGRSNVFQCQGQCGTDWRSIWERAPVNRRTPVRLKDRKLALAHAERPVPETAFGREHQSPIATPVPDGTLPSEALIASSGRDISNRTQAFL